MNTLKILKEDAVAMYGSQAALAKAHGISRSAVSQWPDGKPIPLEQALKLRFLIKPELFNDGNNSLCSDLNGDRA